MIDAEQVSVLVVNDSSQRLHKDTRKIAVSKLAWFFRAASILSFMVFMYFVIERAIVMHDFWILFAISMPLHAIIILSTAWFRYRNPASGKILKGDIPLVTVIIPIYNQKAVIETVIDAAFNSNYPRFEIVAVDDGCTDGTDRILDRIKADKHPSLKVIHKINAGKRKAVASGFNESKGEIVVLIDSDSIIDYNAITEFVKTFKTDPKIGAVVGHVKVWNANANLLTKCQDTWYDFAFNIQKCCESVYHSVTCCSGCLAGYRREAIEPFIPYWSASQQQYADDRELTSFAIANGFGKKNLISMTKRRALAHASQFDDSDDRVLTGVSMSNKWKSNYVSTAVVYTDVPEKFDQFYKQQLRWKKGSIRTNFFVSTFFWKRNPLMAFLFYFEYMGTFVTPILYTATVLYETLVIGEVWFPLFFLGLILWKGFVIGIDYKFRDSSSQSWKYKPVMAMLSTFFLSFLVIPALFQIKKNKWGTR